MDPSSCPVPPSMVPDCVSAAVAVLSTLSIEDFVSLISEALAACSDLLALSILGCMPVLGRTCWVMGKRFN